MYDAKEGKQWSATPENIAVKTHFYSFKNESRKYDTRIESCISMIESAAAPIYEKMVQENFPPEAGTQQKMYFAEFLALMRVRTPAMRKRNDKICGRIIENQIYDCVTDDHAFNALFEQAEQDGSIKKQTPEEKEKLQQTSLDLSAHELLIPEEQGLRVLDRTERLTEILFDMTWTLIRPRHGYFITSDDPIVLTNDIYQKPWHSSLDESRLTNESTIVLFPLTPYLVLFMKTRGTDPPFARCQQETVDNINEMIAERSDQYLYAHLNDEHIAALAAKPKDQRPSYPIPPRHGPKGFANVKTVRHGKKPELTESAASTDDTPPRAQVS